MRFYAEREWAECVLDHDAFAAWMCRDARGRRDDPLAHRIADFVEERQAQRRSAADTWARLRRMLVVVHATHPRLLVDDFFRPARLRVGGAVYAAAEPGWRWRLPCEYVRVVAE